jgi:hypothetical protein
MEVLPDRRLAGVHTGNANLPIMCGSAKHSSYGQGVLKHCFIVLNPRNGSHGIAGDFAMVSKVKHPWHTHSTMLIPPANP